MTELYPDGRLYLGKRGIAELAKRKYNLTKDEAALVDVLIRHHKEIRIHRTMTGSVILSRQEITSPDLRGEFVIREQQKRGWNKT